MRTYPLIVAVLALVALAPASTFAQSTYLSTEDAETFRALELIYDPVRVQAARGHFEELERALNNHAPLEEVVATLRQAAVELATEMVALDEGCVSLLLGRMSEVTAYALDDRFLEDPRGEGGIGAATVALFEAAALSFRTALGDEDSACLDAAQVAATRRPAPASSSESEPLDPTAPHGFGGFGRLSDEGSGGQRTSTAPAE